MGNTATSTTGDPSRCREESRQGNGVGFPRYSISTWNRVADLSEYQRLRREPRRYQGRVCYFRTGCDELVRVNLDTLERRSVSRPRTGFLMRPCPYLPLD